MNVAFVALGVVLLVILVREVFHTLFHPSGQARITTLVFRLTWWLTGRVGQRARRLSGPLSMVAVIALWTSLLLVGWALIYLPALPDDVILASPLDRSDQGGFLDAVYFSWVTQSTLGYGDFAPEADLLRMLAPLQATLGFGLFTLVVTWVLSVYPALQRQRAAAGLAHAIRRAHDHASTSPAGVHPATAARQLERLADMMTQVRSDFTQYPSTFWFSAPGDTLSLAAAMPFATAAAHADGYGDEVRPAAAELAASLDLLASSLAEQHLGMAGASTDDVLRAYRRHQGLGEETSA